MSGLWPPSLWAVSLSLLIRPVMVVFVSKLEDGIGAVGGHTVMHEQEGVEHTALRGAWIPSHRAVLSPRSLSLVTSLEGTMVLNAEL